MLRELVEDLLRCEEVEEVIVRLNVPESVDFPEERVKVVTNDGPRGFGANHNASLASANGRYLAVVNPDIRLPENPFPTLLAAIADGGFGVVAPIIMNPAGEREDNARRFPTLARLLMKLLTGKQGLDDGRKEQSLHRPDWVAGMFLLFDRKVFQWVDGFDEGFFLYYEDVDICARLRKAGYEVGLAKEVQVIHDARRESRRNLRFARWHLGSMMRYFAKHWGRLP